MKRMKKLLSLITVVGVLLGNSLSISANPANTKTSELWVSAGGSSFTSATSQTTAKRNSCYMYLKAFKLNHYPEFKHPGDCRVYSALYSTNKTTKASFAATFAKAGGNGHYNYEYRSGFGRKGESYILKTNCNYQYDGYWAKFEWSANPY